MYLRITQRRNRDGSTVAYYALAENAWNAAAKRSLRSARVPPMHYLDKPRRPSIGTNALGQDSIGDTHQTGSEFNRR